MISFDVSQAKVDPGFTQDPFIMNNNGKYCFSNYDSGWMFSTTNTFLRAKTAAIKSYQSCYQTKFGKLNVTSVHLPNAHNKRIPTWLK
jgi:hypothetical protein